MRRPWVILVTGFGLHLVVLGALQFSVEGFPDLDGWYHAKVARSIGRVDLAPEFAAADDSIWATRFADKEWLYHVYLVPFVRVGERVGGAGSDGVVGAVKLATALLGALALTASLGLMVARGVPRPLWWSGLVLAVGGPMLLRLVAVRPHTISVLLLTLALLCYVSKRDWLLGLVAVVYALSYTAFHTLPVAIVVCSVALAIMRREVRWRPLGVVCVGVVVGLVVHPHFPDNLHTWSVQNVLMWKVQAFGTDADFTPEDFASELRPVGVVDMLVRYGPLLAAWGFGAWALIACRARPGDDTVAVGSVAIAFGVLNAGAERFAEYWTPLSVVTVALGTRDALASPGCGAWLRSEWTDAGKRCAVGLLIVLTVGSMRQALGAYYQLDPVDLRPAARWLAEHAEPGDKVFHAEFTQFGQLWYHHDRGRYLVALDPVFAYARDRERCRTILEVARGQHPDPVAAMRDTLGCRWLVLPFTHRTERLLLQLRRHPRVRRHKKLKVPRKGRPLFDRLPWMARLFGHLRDRKHDHYVVRIFELLPEGR